MESPLPMCDCGSALTSGFWKSFQASMGIECHLSTSCHPQADGQSERNIKVLSDVLRACAREYTGSWDQHLCLVEFAYKNNYHSSIRMVPYETLYGWECRTPLAWFEPKEARLVVPELLE